MPRHLLDPKTMNGNLPSSASVAHQASGAKLHAPAAERNADALCALLKEYAPARGNALELAVGTGQHVTHFAANMPGIHWHPSEVNADRIASIDAYTADAGLSNVAPAVPLDATRQGLSKTHGGYDLVLLVNLLHLIPQEQAVTVIREAVQALREGGRFILYGPFSRSGTFTSDGDARFHAQLSGADPAIGYKDDTAVDDWLRQAGAASVIQRPMPANNLAFIATR